MTSQQGLSYKHRLLTWSAVRPCLTPVALAQPPLMTMLMMLPVMCAHVDQVTSVLLWRMPCTRLCMLQLTGWQQQRQQPQQQQQQQHSLGTSHDQRHLQQSRSTQQLHQQRQQHLQELFPGTKQHVQ